MSYQPEERYWTDYLRIALPVVGLLLMLGLFWFWAANLINDDDDDEPPASVVATNTTPTAVPTTVAAAGGETPGAAPTEIPTAPPDDEEDTPPPDGEDEETQPPDDEVEETPPPDDGEDEDPPPDEGEGDGFAPGTLVEVNDDNVRFRTEPAVSDETIIRVLDNGEELTVVSGPEEGPDGLLWYEVEDTSGTVGWVAADFLQEIA